MRILVLGDVCVVGELEALALAKPEFSICAEIRARIDVDLVVANIEFALTTEERPLPGKWATLRADPKVVSALDGIDIGVIANNHVGDFGEQGARDTASVLLDAGIRPVGWGESFARAIEPVVIGQGERKLAIVALSCLTTNGGNYATQDSAGVALLSRETVVEAVKRAKEAASSVLVYLHWGVEQSSYPVFDQMGLARGAVQAGADAVVGTHAHVIQGWELYRDSPIFYGIGNLAFPDVPCSWYSDDGSKQVGVVRQRRVNQESIGIVLEHTSTGQLRVAEVVTFRFELGEAKCSLMAVGESVVQVAKVNATIANVAKRWSSELDGFGEQSLRIRCGFNGVCAEYVRRTIDCDGALSRSYAVHRELGSWIQRLCRRKWN
ncbi:CapA family protein [Planctellipticum variicoloris]|uniref:CapA family protein n=1 Tax=Planctellipticum variicoloris TaxID=3064265 RepID=UPI003013B11A|nr:CapA family protein [Planctomycetaceae bacterium SH412]